MPTLHGTHLSPYVRKVRIALAEKGIPYELNPIVHFDLPDGFEKLHPLRKIPVWTTDEGENIPDSSVIVAYLDKVNPKPRLVPEDPIHFARAAFLEEFADDALSATIATVFLQKVAYPLVLGQPTNEKVVGKALERLPGLFGHLDETIGKRDFMVGDSLTIADIAIASPLINYRHTGLEVDGDAHPNFKRYADAIINRPTIAEIFAEEVSIYGGLSPEAAARA